MHGMEWPHDTQTHSLTRQGFGGARRDRTDDLKLAKLALSQLSYGPVKRCQTKLGGPGTTRTSDLTLIRGAL